MFQAGESRLFLVKNLKPILARIHHIMSINSLISSSDITLEELQLLLRENPALIGVKDAVGFTPLHHCARNDRVDLAEYILFIGDDKKKEINPAKWRCSTGDTHASGSYKWKFKYN